MKVNPVNMTVADYCAALRRKEVVVDTTYQRSSEVWPERARSYLIETILKGFPIPKLTLHQRTDLRSKKTIEYVVDGQQRTRALQDFYDNDLKLSRVLELKDARSNTYDDLPENLQQAFLAYRLDFDQFEAASEDDVREYFRRMFYSLLLARIAARKWPERAPASPPKRSAVASDAESRLLALTDALDDPDSHPKAKPFVLASTDRTNVKSQRETRVRVLAHTIVGLPA